MGRVWDVRRHDILSLDLNQVRVANPIEQTSGYCLIVGAGYS